MQHRGAGRKRKAVEGKDLESAEASGGEVHIVHFKNPFFVSFNKIIYPCSSCQFSFRGQGISRSARSSAVCGNREGLFEEPSVETVDSTGRTSTSKTENSKENYFILTWFIFQLQKQNSTLSEQVEQLRQRYRVPWNSVVAQVHWTEFSISFSARSRRLRGSRLNARVFRSRTMTSHSSSPPRTKS